MRAGGGVRLPPVRLCALALAVGCGFTNDGAGRVRMPGPFERCAIVIQDDLGASLPSHGGPLAPSANGVECDVVRW